MEIVNIAIERIKPNEYNPNVVSADIMAKLGAEIAQKGACLPIIVRSKDDAYEIVDGEHRWRICRDLGWEEIPCIIHDYSDNEAKIKTLQINYMRGSAVPIRLAHLIHDLNKEIKIEELAEKLPYETVQMMDSLELLKLPDNFGKEIEAQAMAEEEEMPVVWSVVLRKEQAEIVEEAVEEMRKNLPEEVKNSKAVALEKICEYFLSNKGVKECLVEKD